MKLLGVAIREESPGDFGDIDEVTGAAFGGTEEVNIIHRLRDAGLVIASLVAVREGRVIGHVLFSRLPVETDSGVLNAVALGPVAVAPDDQKRGIGGALVREGLERCRAGGERVVLVLGHPGYYPRFGFSAEVARRIDGPFRGDSWMGLELVAGALTGVRGVVRYPAAWGIAPGTAE